MHEWQIHEPWKVCGSTYRHRNVPSPWIFFLLASALLSASLFLVCLSLSIALFAIISPLPLFLQISST